MTYPTFVSLGLSDQSLYDLFNVGAISQEQALENADSRTDLSLRVRLHHGVDPQTAGIGLHYAGEPPR